MLALVLVAVVQQTVPIQVSTIHHFLIGALAVVRVAVILVVYQMQYY
jgi:hypothetical protein